MDIGVCIHRRRILRHGMLKFATTVIDAFIWYKCRSFPPRSELSNDPASHVMLGLGGDHRLAPVEAGPSAAGSAMDDGRCHDVLIRRHGADEGEDALYLNPIPMVPVQMKPSWIQEDESGMLPRTPLANKPMMDSSKKDIDEDAEWILAGIGETEGEEVDGRLRNTKMRHVPLAVALLNLQCLRLGAGICYDGSWAGCMQGAWCSQIDQHMGDCDTCATVPGPGAYLPEELYAVGMSAEPQSWLQYGPLPQVAAEMATSVKGLPLDQVTVPIQEQGERFETPEEQEVKPTRQSTRRRMKKKMDDEVDYLYSGAQLSDEHDSVITGEAQLRTNTESVDGPSKKAFSLKQQQKPVKKATMQPLQEPVTRSKRVSARRSTITSVLQKSKRGGRNVNRKVPQIWVKGEVRDPRTGEMVTEVPPATFCSQCHATSTPVWRAGPFGHKTLCNACGVRWMKVVPKRK